jgi:hypothetical protein
VPARIALIGSVMVSLGAAASGINDFRNSRYKS